MKTKQGVFVLFSLILCGASAFAVDPENTMPKVTMVTTNGANADPAVLMIAGSVLAAWLVLIVLYLAWAIHRYTVNFGLSDHEWKILYPKIYAKGKAQLKLYEELKKTLVSESKASPDTAGTPPIDEPTENPYKNDSFGLPPNTIRGIIALTAIVLFAVMEGVNIFSSRPIEESYTHLIAVVEMVVAFYFGSKAIESLKAESAKKTP